MFFLLITVLVGGLLAILATQNTMSVPIHIASYTWTNVPLYLIAIISLLFGLLVAWFLSMADWASNSLTLHGKNQRIKTVETTVEAKQARIQELETENAALHEKLGIEKAEKKAENPSPMQRLSKTLSS